MHTPRALCVLLYCTDLHNRYITVFCYACSFIITWRLQKTEAEGAFFTAIPNKDSPVQWTCPRQSGTGKPDLTLNNATVTGNVLEYSCPGACDDSGGCDNTCACTTAYAFSSESVERSGSGHHTNCGVVTYSNNARAPLLDCETNSSTHAAWHTGCAFFHTKYLLRLAWPTTATILRAAHTKLMFFPLSWLPPGLLPTIVQLLSTYSCITATYVRSWPI